MPPRARTARQRQMDEEAEMIVAPFDEAVMVDQIGIAGDLSDIFEALKGYDHGSIKGVLWKKPPGGVGKFEWIEDASPPFDMSAIFGNLKDRFGGGDFELRIFAGGKQRKVVPFSIVREKEPEKINVNGDGGLMPMMFQMMTMQMQEAARQRADDMRDRQQAAERQMTMLVGLATAALPIFAGGREKTSELMQALAAMRPEAPKNDMLETLTVLEKAKGLFGNGGETPGFDPDDIAGSLVKIAGPVAGALGKAFSGRNGAATDNPQAVQNGHAPGPLMLPTPRTTHSVTEHQAMKGDSRYPLLDLVRDDVLYCFMRGHSPDRAAEMVYDTIDAHDVSDEAINEVFTAFTLAGDNWLTDLAAEGIDLRSRPEWATEFLAALVDIHVNAGEDDDAEGRGSGGQADAVVDGGTGGTG